MKNIELRDTVLSGLQKVADKRNMLVDELASDVIQEYLLNLDDEEPTSKVQEIILTNEDFEGLEQGLQL